MTLELPTSPYPAQMTPRLISARSDRKSAFGGGTQRMNRMGSRYAIDFVLPPQTYDNATDWGDLTSEGETVSIAIPQPRFDTGAPGSPLVDGAGQSGTTLNIKGLTPQYVVRKRQWLSITTSGRSYAYRAAAEAVADASGDLALTLETMLRTPHGDGNVIELGEPVIEGFPTVPDDAWKVGPDGLVYLSFTIEEID